MPPLISFTFRRELLKSALAQGPEALDLRAEYPIETLIRERTLGPDGTEIEGRWTVRGKLWSGKLLRHRSASEAVARRCPTRLIAMRDQAVDSQSRSADHHLPPPS